MPDLRFRLPDEAWEASAAIRRCWDATPAAGLILGTGLGNVARHIETDATIDYEAIPHFSRSRALSHRGRLVCGHLAGTPLVIMEGRWHYYEGHPVERLALPVYVMRALGVEWLILSNAAGGLNPQYASGDIVVIEDHINLMFWRPPPAGAVGRNPRANQRPQVGETPSAGAGQPSGWFRQPAGRPYDPALIAQALAISRRENFVAHQGVYVAMSGPNYETRAEYRFLRKTGGDVVGMSTVPEALAAARCGIRTLALSIVTNVARPDAPKVTTAEDVVAAAERAQPNVRKIVVGVLAARSAPA